MKKNVLLLFVLMLLPMVASATTVEINGIYYNLDSQAKTAEVIAPPKDKYAGNIVIPESVIFKSVEYNVISIGEKAFYQCRDLDNVTIPASVINIGADAFNGCWYLNSLTIPASVTKIGVGAFYQIWYLSSIVVEDGNTVFDSRDNCNAIIDTKRDSLITGCKNTVIPNSVRVIGDYAFASCYRLTSITIPNSVTSIGEGAFNSCSYLTSVTIGNSVTSIGKWAFLGCKGLTSITIPNSVTSIGFEAFNNCTGLTSVHITDLEAWCKIAFSNYSSNPLGYALHLFLNGNEIKDLIIPSNVTSIGKYAFRNCKALTSVSIPSSVTEVGECVFESCTSLISVTINNNIIGSDAFRFCTGLTSVTIPNSVTSIGGGAFYGCTGLTSVTIGNSVTSIGSSAFYGCTGLTSVVIPNSVTSIGSYAFRGCSGLTSITIPNNVTSIEGYAFSGCTGLTSVTIPNNLTSIGYSAFSGCTGLTSINIPNSVTWIGDGAFSGCASLKSVSIGSGVKNIYSRAFANCSGLADVYCHAEKVPSTNSNAFENSYIEYTTLHVPEAFVENYKVIVPWKNFKEIKKIMPMFTLTYIVDSEVYKSYQVEEDESITPEPAPTKEGYTFSGWSEIPETMPAHDVTVTGSFSINKYKLIYIVDNEEYKSYEIEYGADITAEPTPTKEGYTFSGWSEIPETMPAKDVTITGSFTINKYKITYIVDGEEYKSYEVEYGADITAEPTPTKEGYTFAGWSEIPETMPANDVTVTGTFSINSYKLTYMIDNKVYKEVSYEYGATITPEPQPEGDYQTFEWTDLPQTMPAHDVVVHANYTTGIVEIIMAQGDVRIYSPDGKPRNELQKGLNIVRMSDGTVKKVVIK